MTEALQLEIAMTSRICFIGAKLKNTIYLVCSLQGEKPPGSLEGDFYFESGKAIPAGQSDLRPLTNLRSILKESQ